MNSLSVGETIHSVTMLMCFLCGPIISPVCAAEYSTGRTAANTVVFIISGSGRGSGSFSVSGSSSGRKLCLCNEKSFTNSKAFTSFHSKQHTKRQELSFEANGGEGAD